MSRLRVGIVDAGIAARPSASTATRANYLSAAASRVDSFWIPDHLNSLAPRALWTPEYCGVTQLIPRTDANLEPWTMVGHLAARNWPGRLRLGVAVTDAGRRNPAVTAQAAATLHLLSKGRAILGVGAGEREGNEPYGVEWSKPVARFEEALATIRALWDSAGELVNRDSPYFPLRSALFDLPPYRGEWPEIWVAAHGPRMLRLTGRYADAWFPYLANVTQQYEKCLEVARTAASDHGRDPMALTPALLAPIVTGRSPDDVEEAMQSHLVKAYALTAPGDLFTQVGAEHPFGPDFSGLQDILPFALDEDSALAAVSRVPRSVVQRWALCGTPAEVIEQAAAWRDRGVRYLAVANNSVLQRSFSKALASTLPFNKIVRGLKRL
ncbi:LLM class flavin-dependent oxidoreductase [Mycobacterium montefiorense]|uniref:LLM class flavin-dependent oxidoreductase n=1 Tax=Mycobacterium montefiorense TaxID=154654 RepID=UPI0021DDF881|nr:LLM class flavin-dependent oxidoreductase [Mycobacterium montefiorense]MCV7426978.1 LLM class flavin-dependent oxidoreductase [Mycobacterium montefiorense]GLE51683.1 phthiodiolone/phenolphthiodiolone dimycocerosates ketoreductase [Mycobacterium montefiorense]